MGTEYFGKYKLLGPFINGYARAELEGKCGIINEKGEEVVPCEY